MVYVHQSPRGCRCGMDGPWCCHRVRGASGTLWLLCPDAMTVRGCWLGPASTGEPSRGFFGGEGVKLEARADEWA
jgi:hypothetical protein